MKKKIFFIFFIMILLCFFYINSIFATGNYNSSKSILGGLSDYLDRNYYYLQDGAEKKFDDPKDELDELLSHILGYAMTSSTEYREKYKEILEYSDLEWDSSTKEDFFDSNEVIQKILKDYGVSDNEYEELKNYFLYGPNGDEGLNYIMTDCICEYNEETGKSEQIIIDPSEATELKSELINETISGNGSTSTEDYDGAEAALIELLKELQEYASTNTDGNITYQEKYKELLKYSGELINAYTGEDFFDVNERIQTLLAQYGIQKSTQAYEVLKSNFVAQLNSIIANDIYGFNEETQQFENKYIDPTSSTATSLIAEATDEVLNGGQSQQPPQTNNNPQYSGETAESLWQLAINFLHKGSSEESLDLEKASKPFVEIGQLLTTVAIIVLTIATLVMGIKYMMATPDKKATIKKQLIGLIASALVIFSAYTIWSIAVNLLSESVEGEPSKPIETTSTPITTSTSTPYTPGTSLEDPQRYFLNLMYLANETGNERLEEILNFYSNYQTYHKDDVTITKEDRDKVNTMIEDINKMVENGLEESYKKEIEWLLKELKDIAKKPIPTPVQINTPEQSKPPTSSKPEETPNVTPNPS